MAQRGRPRKIHPIEASDRDAVILSTIRVDGVQQSFRFTVPNIAGHLLKSQRTPGDVQAVVLAALRARFGQTVRAE